MHPELQYRDLIAKILSEGFYRPSPHDPLPGKGSNPGTFSLVNENMVFDLSDGTFPLMTLRSFKSSFRALVAELLWFLSGSMNVSFLNEMGVRLWDQWATEETAGLYGYSNGDVGPLYGSQWRNFGARAYRDGGRTLIEGPGFDQIAHLVNEIKTRPHSKRMMVTTWHPADAEYKSWLAPCHGIFHCSVEGDRLNLHMFQRSGDVPIGIPFNVASYSLLVMMLAQVTQLKPGKFYHTISDAHVYEDQIESIRPMLDREPKPYPTVRINPEVQDIFGFAIDDFELIGYHPHPAIKGIPVAT